MYRTRVMLAVLLLASVRNLRSADETIVMANRLRDLLESVRAMMQDLSGKPSGSQVNASATPVEIFREAKNEAFYLREEIRKVKKLKLIDIRKIQSVRTECMKKVETMKKKMSELREKASLEETNYKNNCTRHLQEFKNESLANCSAIESRRKEICHDLVVDYLLVNNYRKAFIYYKELNDDTDLSEFKSIVRASYDAGSAIIETVVKFIESLEDCKLKKSARSILIQIMIEEEFNNLDILHLEAMQGCVYEDAITIHLNRMREYIAYSMIDGECSFIGDFLYKSPVSELLGMEEMKKILHQVFVLREARVFNLVKCFKQLRDTRLTLIGYTAIFDKIEKSNSLLRRMTIYLANNLDQMIKGKSPPLEAFSLKARFPTVVKDIIWKRYCSFKNIHYREWLYLADKSTEDRVRRIKRRLLTLKSGFHAAGSEWLLQPVNDGEKFKLKNTKSADGDYMCVGPLSDKGRADQDYESVGATNCDSSEWEIHLDSNVNASADHVWLKNPKHGYIHATPHSWDGYSRHVYVRKGPNVPAARWRIECADKMLE